MGYFDSVKAKPKPAHAAATEATVTPIRRDPDRDGLHPYAARAIEGELARLDACRAAPLGHPPHWDETTFEVACNLLEIANSPWSGYTVTDAHADLHARAPRDSGFDDRRIDAKWASAEKKVGATSRPQPAPTATSSAPQPTILDAATLTPAQEDEFWNSRPFLAHIRQFAHARRVSPWAVLGVALLRIVTATPHQVCLPPIVGGRGSLNQFVGLVGPSGSGKGAAEAVAAEAVHVGYIESHSVGSGEGIAHGYMHRKRSELCWNDDTHAVLFSVPEIDSMTALGDRKGATLMPQLRSAWSGERLGFGYADPTKRILIPAHEYRLCLVAGIQPARAGALLDDADGGTPQRFLWLPAIDPDAPQTPPDEPAPFMWESPHIGSLAAVGGIRMAVCLQARDTIIGARLQQLRGDTASLDGHALQTRLKTAAALALTESRLDITDEDWALAGTIMDKSTAVRADVARALASRASEANYARADAEATRTVHIAERVTDAAVKRVCNVLLRKLRREGDWLTRSALRRALASDDRRHFETALERLLEAGQVDVDQDPAADRFRVAKGAGA